MEYAILLIVGLFIAYKIIIGLGRKSAKDWIVETYGIDRLKLDSLSDPEITSLTISLNSFAARGDVVSLSRLIEKFK